MSTLPINEKLSMNSPAIYRITVRGVLDPSWSNRLGGMSISKGRSGHDENDAESILEGRLQDQAALSSVLNALYELHFPVVSADCLKSG